MADATTADNNTIQAEENAITPNALSSSDQSLIPATPTPQPGEQTPTMPPDTGTEAVRQAPEAPAGAGEVQPVGPDGQPTTPKWVQRRIDKLTAEKHEARRETENAKQQAEALLASLAELRAAAATGGAAPVPGQAPVTPVPGQQPAGPAALQPLSMNEAEIEARATAKANEIARVNAFNKACNDIADAGKTEFKDFDAALNNFTLLGGIPSQMLSTLTEMPNAHKVLYAVGKDPELIEKLGKLPPMKMAMELARIEQNIDRPANPLPISGAPRPITPIDTGGRAGEDPDRMDTKAWLEWREKTKKTRW